MVVFLDNCFKFMFIKRLQQIKTTNKRSNEREREREREREKLCEH